MSAFYDRADEIAARIETLFGAGEIAVIVDRQKDIASEFNKMIGRMKGGVAIVEWRGAPNVNEDLDELRMTSRFSVTVICKPVIRKAHGQKTADDIAETIAGSLHQWNPEAGSHCMNEMRVTGIDPFNHAKFLIYVINVEQQLNAIETA